MREHIRGTVVVCETRQIHRQFSTWQTGHEILNKSFKIVPPGAPTMKKSFGLGPEVVLRRFCGS